jgi:uncharacterized protein (TIGR02145 family)
LGGLLRRLLLFCSFFRFLLFFLLIFSLGYLSFFRLLLRFNFCDVRIFFIFYAILFFSTLSLMAQEHALARRFAATVLIALAAVQASHSSYGKGSFTDNRDGKTYKFVKIGTQTWMAENLNYAAKTGSWCYNDSIARCNKYGRLYDWATALALPSSCNEQRCAGQVQPKHRGVCPSGWHLPSDAEWNVLISYAGGEEVAGRKLKAKNDWISDRGIGTDDYGFSALPGGRCTYGKFHGADKNKIEGLLAMRQFFGAWWSTEEDSEIGAYIRGMTSFDGSIEKSHYSTVHSNKIHGYSVRCLKD